MTVTGVAGVGASFSRWNGSEYEVIGKVTAINGISMTRETLDTTALDTSGGFRTFIGSFIDGGDVTLSMNFSRQYYEYFFTDLKSPDPVEYLIALPDADKTQFAFDGLVTKLPVTIESAAIIKSDITVKVSGEPEIDSGV